MGQDTSRGACALLALGCAATLVLEEGCGRKPSQSADDAGTVQVLIEPNLVNYHSMGLSWTTTFSEADSLRYRLYIWDDNTVSTVDVPAAGYFEISLSSAGDDRVIPVTGFEASQTYYVWVTAYRLSPAMTIVAESERVTFKTCDNPYARISRQPRRLSGHRAAAMAAFAYVVWPDQTFERFDPATNEWAQLSQVPHPHSNFGLATLGGKLYVIGGQNSADVDVYDPGPGTWSSRAPIPGGISVQTAVTLRDTVFTFAATDQLSGDRTWDSYAFDRQVTAYVPGSDSWFPRAERPGSSTVIGPVVPFQNRLYLFGGYSPGTRRYGFVETTLSESIYVFNPDSNLWRFADYVFDRRVGFHAVEYGGSIYLLGGLLEWTGTELTWTVPPGLSYGGTTSGWRLRTLLGAPLDFGEDAAAVSVGSAIYFVNGGDRWPGTTGRYAPESDACGVDIVVWEDTIPYGIPYTAAGKTKVTRAGPITVGEPRPRR